MRYTSLVAVLLAHDLLCQNDLFVFGVEDEFNTGDADIDATPEDGIGYDDKIMLFFVFGFFGFTVSLFGSFLGYISSLEDKIIRQYLNMGNVILGDVVSTEFTRGVGSSNGNVRFTFGSPKEYFVSVEYSQQLSTNYPIRVRKQLRVLEDEFFSPDHQEVAHTYSQSNSVFCTSCTQEVNEETIETSMNDHCKFPTTEIEFMASAESFFRNFYCQGKKLQLLVLPHRHLSAIPLRQAERRVGIKYRLFSLSFVTASMLIAIFCFHLAAQFLLPDDEQLQPGTSFDAMLLYPLFAILALAPVPAMHFFLHDAIWNSLEVEYFETGEVIKGGLGDSSLSTWNSDSILGFRPSAGSL
jgi:hypothetical protein